MGNKNFNQKLQLLNSPLLTIAFVAALAGLISPMSKLALEAVPSFSFVFLRLGLSALFIFFFMKWRGLSIGLVDIRKLFSVAIFWDINILLFAFGVQRTDASTAQLIHVAIPVVTAVLAFLIIGEKLTGLQWSGSFLALSGVSLIIIFNDSFVLSFGEVAGNLLVCASAFSFSLFAVVSKREQYKLYDPLQVVFVAAFLGAILFTPVALYETWSQKWFTKIEVISVIHISIVVLATIFLYTFMQTIIKKTGPSYATVILYLVFFAATLWSVIFLDESLTLVKLCGALCILSGVVIFNKHKPKIEMDFSELEQKVLDKEEAYEK